VAVVIVAHAVPTASALKVPGSVATVAVDTAIIAVFSDKILYPAPTIPPDTVNTGPFGETALQLIVKLLGVTCKAAGAIIVTVAVAVFSAASLAVIVTDPPADPAGTVTVIVTPSAPKVAVIAGLLDTTV